jgi:hypothetical protein
MSVAGTFRKVAMKSVRIARTSALLSLLLLVLVAPLRAAPDGTLDGGALELRYGLSWGGVQLATLALRHDADPDGYVAETRMATTGLLDQVVRYRGHSRIAGQRGPAGELIPVAYRMESERRSKTRTATLEFDPETGRLVQLETTKGGEPRNSDVPEAQRQGVVDPLTALLQVRDWAGRARLGDTTPLGIAVFDGRRRYDVTAAWQGRDRISLAGRSWPALRLELRLVPVAGFDDDDLRHTRPNENALALELLLSDDRRLLPLRLQTLNATITGVARLLEDCSAEPGCQLAAR